MRSSHSNLIISCFLLSILLNLYLFNKQSVMEVNCIIDMETVENITAPRISRSQDQAPICRNFTRIPSDKTLQTTLYAFPIGGLGNNLFELISLLGIASTLHRAPVVDATRPEFITTFQEKIQPIFPNLVDQYHLRILPPNSTKNESLNHGPCCKFDNPNKFSNITDEHLYLKGVYLQSFKYFHHLRSEVRKWLAPTSVAKELAGMQLPQAMRQDFIICPHVRRGDFKTDELHEPSDASFTRAATDFLVEKYKKSHFNVSVVVHGNDLQFAYTVFQQDKFLNSSSIISNPYNFTVPKKSPDYQVLISQSTTPELDLAFSRAYCDVTLITAPSSTFGFWLSYLSKDTSVTYYRNINETTDKVANEMKDEDFFPPDWIMLETGRNGKIRRAERNI